MDGANPFTARRIQLAQSTPLAIYSNHGVSQSIFNYLSVSVYLTT